MSRHWPGSRVERWCLDQSPWARDAANSQASSKIIMRPSRSRNLGTDPLIVAESPDAALNHDRALRALLAGDHAGRARRGAAGLANFALHRLEGQAHQ